jgi:SET domain-containing protein
MISSQDWVSPKIRVVEIFNKGRGLFANEMISEGEVVLIWGGEYVDKETAEKEKMNGKLVMQFDENLYSVENRKESNAYFLNHSCSPNVWMSDAHTLVAMRTIENGEELTADYALWEDNEEKISTWNCVCGSGNCRGKVTGKDWMIKELQKKYKGHFSPLINKRIKEII